MHRICLTLVATLLLVTPLLAAVPGGSHIVLVRDDIALDGAARALSQRHGLTITHRYQRAIHGFAVTVPQARVAALRADPRVRSVVVNRPVSLPGPFLPAAPGGKKGKPEQGDGGGTDGEAPAIADMVPTGISRCAALAAHAGLTLPVVVDVAVVDTGIDDRHSDLNVVASWTAFRGPPRDGHGHGTHVAGTIAARAGNGGVIGIVPGARLHGVKVLNNAGSGSDATVIAGLDWVLAHADTIAVANLSLGRPRFDGDLSGPMASAVAALIDAGVVVVVAAGNDAGEAVNYMPAALASVLPVLTVSAIADSDGSGGGAGTATGYGRDDSFATFSNYGAAVSMAAPGVAILSTYPGDAFATASGTSMAAPHVAGGAAMHIVTSGKPTDANGVQAVLDALMVTASQPGDADYFTGDPDSAAEPLLKLAPSSDG
ncbi:MAG: S8 family serine peptidase [Planctomycetota bacterium]|jgi:subtilisin family serine protease